MRGHLTSAGRRIGRRSHGLQHHFVRCDAQRQGQRAVAIIGIEPVVAGAQHEPRGNLDGLMTGPESEKRSYFGASAGFRGHRCGERYIRRNAWIRSSRPSLAGSSLWSKEGVVKVAPVSIEPPLVYL